MNIKEFTALAAEEVLSCLRENGVDEVSVQTTQLMKMNDQQLYGLTFQRNDDPAPTYYLNEMFRAYSSGENPENLFRCLAAAYLHDRLNGPTPEEIPDLEYRKVKSKTGVRLLGKDYNEQYLQTVPHKDVGNGFALICEVQIGASDGGLFSTIVTKSMAEEYDYDMDQLFKIALENAWRTNPASLRPISGMLGEAGGPESCYVLTTRRQMYGAAALFYPGTQSMVAETLGEDFFAIPSSVHEFIIIGESQVEDPETLRHMVIEANHIVVAPEDVLSDNLLYYSKSTGNLSLVLPEEAYEDFAG